MVNGLLRVFFLPELRTLPHPEQALAWAAARRTEFDTFELLGIAAAVVLTAVLTRYVLPDGSTVSRLTSALLNFALAVPLLVLAVGPLHLRRLRRGVRAWCAHRVPA